MTDLIPLQRGVGMCGIDSAHSSFYGSAGLLLDIALSRLRYCKLIRYLLDPVLRRDLLMRIC